MRAAAPVPKILALALLMTIAGALPADAGDALTILVTSNLEGRFTPEIERQEESDPMILMGQSLMAENRGGRILYLDLGNAFYPGILSKQNYGAAVMDFFSHFRCRASLVSSNDLRIGVTSLEFLQGGSATRLLSANIVRDGRTLFTPYFIHAHGGRKIAFIGLSSRKILFDIAEKNVYKISMEDELSVLTRLTAELKNQGTTDIVLLSGMRFTETMRLMKAFPAIRIALCGGDNRGYLTGGTVTRVDMVDGRSLVSVPPGMGYCVLTLAQEEKLSLGSLQFRKATRHEAAGDEYREFIRRITNWKKQFAGEVGQVLTTIERPANLDQGRIAALMRDVSYAELAIVRNDTVNPLLIENNIKLADILAAINDNYSVYTYRLTGADLAILAPLLRRYTVSGYDNGLIQGYTVDPRRKYLVISTQTVYEELLKELKKNIAYRNTWKTIPDILAEDLKSRKAVLREDFRYLDRRFRFVMDIFVSAFYETSKIIVDSTVKVPVGEPSKSYNKWGVETQLDFTFYNRLHKIIITPYLNYSRENDQFLKNLIRGTCLYLINVNPVINPYLKSQAETVILPVRGAASMPGAINDLDDLIQFREYRRLLRPVIIRETAGIFVQSKYINSSLGCGIEKYIHEPVRPVVFGFEAIVRIRYDFLKYLSYSLKLDSFLSVLRARGKDREKNYLRCEIENALTVKLTEILGLSLKHRWNYFQNLSDQKRYSNSQFLTSCDVRTDFKM